MPRMLARAGIVVALFLAPSLALAAATDVSMSTTVVLNIGGIEIDISGSTAVVESITVGASSFNFVLQSGSSIEVTAPSRNIMDVNTSSDRVTSTCSATKSILKYVGTGQLPVTITPSATLCGASSSSSSRSSSSSATPATPAASTTPAVPAIPASPSSSGLTNEQITAILNVLAAFDADAATIASVRAALMGTGGTTTTTTGSVTSTAVRIFKANLTTGSLGSEVKALQMFLNAHGYLVASSGPGSSGNETTTFGGLTRAALVKYQKAKGITPAVGYFGPLTRAAINAEQ